MHIEADSDPLHDDETPSECNLLAQMFRGAIFLRPDGKDLRIRRRFLVLCLRGTIAILLIMLNLRALFLRENTHEFRPSPKRELNHRLTESFLFSNQKKRKRVAALPPCPRMPEFQHDL